MATNMSLKENIKARRGAVNEFISMPVEEKSVYKLGFKAYIQLALRTGQYKAINVIEVYEGELKQWNPVTEELVIALEGRQSDTVIGYAGYFELLSGFKKCVFWYKSELDRDKDRDEKEHNDYKKIVVRDMLTKWGILNLDMQSACAPELNEEVLLYKPLLKDEEIYSFNANA